MLQEVQVDDLTNEAVSDTIDKIRGKFKTGIMREAAASYPAFVGCAGARASEPR